MALKKGRIVPGSIGSFLCPPNHPMHEWAVETDLRPENRETLSLDYAAGCDYLTPETRAEAKALLDTWQPGTPDLDWIHQILGYFKGSYRNPSAEKQWNVDTMVFDARDPLTNADDHAGVHHIRKFYPDFTPTREHFTGAYWGKRP